MSYECLSTFSTSQGRFQTSLAEAYLGPCQILKSDSHLPKKNCVIYFIESPLKMIKNCFLFHLKSFRFQDI